MRMLAFVVVLAFLGITLGAAVASKVEEMTKTADITSAHDWNRDPLDIDHRFMHHEELFDAIRSDQKSFDAFDIFHVKGNGAHPFLNLGAELEDYSKAYDTKTSFTMYDNAHYLDLDHASAKVRSLDDSTMLLCHADAAKIHTGSYILGTGEGEWINTDHAAAWVSNTDHVGPRIKRKITENSLSDLGLVLSRQVQDVSPSGTAAGCVDITTKTIHPNAMFKNMRVESFFHAHSAKEASTHNIEHGLEEELLYEGRAIRRLDFMADGNGVQYCDDTVEKNQKPTMTKKYNQWKYDSRDWGWYKGKYDVPAAAGGGQVMYLASLISSAGSGCFMYMNELDVFNWNTDMSTPSSPKAENNPYVLTGTPLSGIICANCFAYLGAKVRVVVEFQNKNSEVRFMAFVGGEAAAFAELQVNSYIKSFTRSGEFEYPEPENSYKDVAIGNTGIKFYWKGGGFAYEVNGQVETTGQIRASSGVYAHAYIFAAYGGDGGEGETFYVNKSAGIDYEKPNIKTSSSFTVEKCSATALVTGTVNFKIGRSLKVFGKELGITAVFSSSLRKEVKVRYGGSGGGAGPVSAVSASILTANTDAAADTADEKRTLVASETDLPVYRPGDVITMRYEYTDHDANVEQTVFASLITGGDGETPVAQKTFVSSATGSGSVTLEFLVPWNRNYQGGELDDADAKTGSTIKPTKNHCHFLLRSSHDEHTLTARSSPFHLEAFTERDSIFSSPPALAAGAHGETLFSDKVYEVKWNKDVLWHYVQQPHHRLHGERWTADKVTFELIGETIDAKGKVHARTSFHDLGVHANAGFASITFPTEATALANGHRFYLVIKAVGASYLQGWSSGYFRFHSGMTDMGIPVVSIATQGIDAALRKPTHHKVLHSRSYVSAQDFAASGRAGGSNSPNKQQLQQHRRLQNPEPSPSNINNGCQKELYGTDANFGLSGKAGMESLVGNIDFTSNMVSKQIGLTKSTCKDVSATKVSTGGSIPDDTAITLDSTKIPDIGSVNPVPAPKNEPPPPLVPAPPMTKLRGWLVTKIYSDCNQATDDPIGSQIVINAESVGLCKRVGDGDGDSNSVFQLNAIDVGAKEARTWYFSGPKAHSCDEDALIRNSDGEVKYQTTDLSVGECVKLGGSSQLHYSVTTYVDKIELPLADFGAGTGYAFWDDPKNCGTSTNLTSFHISNPGRCYAVQSIASLDSRQATCSASGANMTVSTYYSDPECTSSAHRVKKTIPFKNCAPTHFYASSFGQTGYLPSADNYLSTFCSNNVPYAAAKRGGSNGGSGASSGGTVSKAQLSGGAIAGIVVMMVTIIAALCMLSHYYSANKNPFNLWGNDAHSTPNWISGDPPASEADARHSKWLAERAEGAASDSVEMPRRPTTVVNMEGAYPEGVEDVIRGSMSTAGLPQPYLGTDVVHSNPMHDGGAAPPPSRRASSTPMMTLAPKSPNVPSEPPVIEEEANEGAMYGEGAI